MMMNELNKNQSATVKKINRAAKIKKRLYDIGFTEGVKITVIGFAPAGDPVRIRIRDFYLALRLSETEKIEVENIE